MRCGTLSFLIMESDWSLHLKTTLLLFGMSNQVKCCMSFKDTIVVRVVPRLHCSSHGTGINYVSWSPDDSRLLTCGNRGDNKVVLWNTATGNKILHFEHMEAVVACAWTSDGRFVTGSEDMVRETLITVAKLMSLCRPCACGIKAPGCSTLGRFALQI